MDLDKVLEILLLKAIEIAKKGGQANEFFRNDYKFKGFNNVFNCKFLNINFSSRLY